MVLNIPIAIFCYRFLGRDFFIDQYDNNNITDNKQRITVSRCLQAIRCCTQQFAGSAFGHRIRYDLYRNSSTGGTGLHHNVYQKLRPHLTIGKISFALDTFIIIAGTLAVSRQMENLIYGMIISFIMSTVVDKVMYGLSAGKMTLIVTTKPEEVRRRR